MSVSRPEGFRRRLAEAADALEAFRREAGLPAPAEAVPSWRVPSDAGARAALEDASRRLRSLERELAQARRNGEELAAENRRLTAEAAEREAAVEGVEAARVRAVDAEADAGSLRERATLLEAECVRLESLRRKADEAVGEAEAAGRSVAERLRGQLRAANAELDRAASRAGAAEAKSKAEADGLLKRLESAMSRLQTLERERRLDSARSAGDSSALFGELERAKAVDAALRAELSAARRALDDARGELEVLRAQARRARPTDPS